MKAEALLRTGRASEAAALVTQVRERAFDDPSEAQVSGAELRQGSTINYGYRRDGEVVDPEGGDDIRYGRFLDELGWEFALEGHRRQDLIRFETTSGEVSSRPRAGSTSGRATRAPARQSFRFPSRRWK